MIIVPGKYYVYAHYTLDGELFYIGSGKSHRPSTSEGRNDLWTIVAKNGFIVRVLNEFDTKAEALWWENILIRKNQKALVNKREATGEDHFNWATKWSEEHKEKLSKAKLGKKQSEEHKRAIAKALTGRKRSDAEKAAISRGHTGKILKEETKRLLSEINSGERNPRYGVPMSDDAKRKSSESQRGKPKSKETRLKMSNSAKLRCAKKKLEMEQARPNIDDHKDS